MKPRDQKLAIHRLLSQEAESITLSELIVKLNFKLTDRTMRRYLNDLIKDRLVKSQDTQKMRDTSQLKFFLKRSLSRKSFRTKCQIVASEQKA